MHPGLLAFKISVTFYFLFHWIYFIFDIFSWFFNNFFFLSFGSNIFHRKSITFHASIELNSCTSCREHLLVTCSVTSYHGNTWINFDLLEIFSLRVSDWNNSRSVRIQENWRSLKFKKTKSLKFVKKFISKMLLRIPLKLSHRAWVETLLPQDKCSSLDEARNNQADVFVASRSS